MKPNGQAFATVNGQVTGYKFEWFEPSKLPDPVFDGSYQEALDSITYYVKATDIHTGCESAMGEITILNEITDPEFVIDVKNSMCIRDESGGILQHTGSASVIFKDIAAPDGTGNSIDSIRWIDPTGNAFQVSASGVGLEDAAPGIWSVWFRANNGCDYTSTFEISIALRVYNGVSANGDGKNDYFFIDCVEYFPNNRVTIYNRDGSLVWEDKNYDNVGVRFEGLSNVGKQGLRLPVGTYFYFIDKGDGSDVVHGYLELVR